jgi:hypothetical protein
MTHPSLLASVALLLLFVGCAGREDLCIRVCEKAAECEEGEEGHRDLSYCSDQCEETAEQTADACTEEFRRYSKCLMRRFDCDGRHNNTCSRRRDQLNTCLNAQRQ